MISKKNVTLANEPSIQKYAEGIKELEGIKVLEYYVFHNKELYIIGYKASENLYEKYLPDFGKNVKIFQVDKLIYSENYFELIILNLAKEMIN